MFWEEKIDRIKTKFPQKEFRVPFLDGKEIVKKIEARFVISSKPAYRRSLWSEGLKQRTAIRKIAQEAIYTEISKLDPASNYWAIIVLGNASEAQQLVYDCTPAAMAHLIAIAPTDFYIGDKKYQWLVYFNIDSAHNEVSLIKANDFPTPFDALTPVPS